MTETVLVRPRTGIILPGIPRSGAAIPKALAEEWLGNRLVVRVEPAAPVLPVAPKAPGPSRSRKRRRR